MSIQSYRHALEFLVDKTYANEDYHSVHVWLWIDVTKYIGNRTEASLYAYAFDNRNYLV